MEERLYFEHLTPGRIFWQRVRYVIVRDGIVASAREFDPDARHYRQRYRLGAAFGELVASGCHAGSSASKLMTENLPTEAGGLGGSLEIR